MLIEEQHTTRTPVRKAPGEGAGGKGGIMAALAAMHLEVPIL